MTTVVRCPSALLAALLVAACPAVAPAQTEDRIRSNFSNIQQPGFEMRPEPGGRWERLTFSPRGGTNLTLLRIDGKDVVFGYGTPVSAFSPEDRAGHKQEGKFTGPEEERRRGRAVWSYQDLEVIQEVSPVPSVDRTRDVCVVTYQVRSRSGSRPEVGVRVLLDVMLGDNNAPVYRSGSDGPLSVAPREFRPDELPRHVWFQQSPSVDRPGLRACLTTEGGTAWETAARLRITARPPKLDLWEVPLERLGADSVVVLYWEPKQLPAEGQRRVGFAYGLGSHRVVDRGPAKEK